MYAITSFDITKIHPQKRVDLVNSPYISCVGRDEEKMKVKKNLVNGILY